METASLLAVCRVHQLLPDESSVGVTAIDKRPVEGPVKVHKLGVRGDVQASRLDHGGEDQAVYAYSQADADFWAGALGRELPPGIFGENLRVSGIDATGAVIGERWKIGLDVELEVTSPRVPCAAFQRRMGEPQWVKRFTAEGRVAGAKSSRGGIAISSMKLRVICCASWAMRMRIGGRRAAVIGWYSLGGIAGRSACRMC